MHKHVLRHTEAHKVHLEHKDTDVSPKGRWNSGGKLNRFDDSGEVMIMVIHLCYGTETEQKKTLLKREKETMLPLSLTIASFEFSSPSAPFAEGQERSCLLKSGSALVRSYDVLKV